jgi:hypothetical protein
MCWTLVNVQTNIAKYIMCFFVCFFKLSQYVDVSLSMSFKIYSFFFFSLRNGERRGNPGEVGRGNPVLVRRQESGPIVHGRQGEI